jgi:hypothetical protein
MSLRLAESPCSTIAAPAGLTPAGGSMIVTGVWQPLSSSTTSCLGSAERRIVHALNPSRSAPRTASTISQRFTAFAAARLPRVVELVPRPFPPERIDGQTFGTGRLAK